MQVLKQLDKSMLGFEHGWLAQLDLNLDHWTTSKVLAYGPTSEACFTNISHLLPIGFLTQLEIFVADDTLPIYLLIA